MPRVKPFFRKYCCCITLKTYLQVWSFVKLLADLTVASFFTLLVTIFKSELVKKEFILFLIIIAVVAIDCFFQTVLTAALCTKNRNSLRVFYYYSFYMVFISATFVVGFIIHYFLELRGARHDIFVFFVIVICLLINAALDICIIFALRSEMMRLQNNQQYEFVSLNREEEKIKVQPIQYDIENVA